MNKYAGGKIYKLSSTVDNEFYIGSTCKTLKVRYDGHKFATLRTSVKTRHFDNIGWNNVAIELIEDYPCDSRRELEECEKMWIDELCPTLNTKIPANDYDPVAYHKEYVNNNRAKINENSRKSRAKHSAARSAHSTEKIRCECGTMVSRCNIAVHKTSQKHARLIK